ncbi:hypothetical protein [Armatimonas sp.]|uniref:hypothetical protein n=1 Tax=Armatimonas sp. TaxID=1872638 RepID=UPI00286C2D10|nr:hypothetical protein [Armatimonas sp.]
MQTRLRKEQRGNWIGSYWQGEHLTLFFHGNPWEDYFFEFIRIISEPDISGVLISLEFHGPDEGINGTRNWDFSVFLQQDISFPHLKRFIVAISKPSDHNRSIIGEDYEENGQLAMLLNYMPSLVLFAAPSAPNADFFARTKHPLERLFVGCGYDHQDFILNLSQATCFPVLSVFGFNDFSEFYLSDWRELCVPFNHYQALFQALHIPEWRYFSLTSSLLTREERDALHALRPELQFFCSDLRKYHEPTN